MFPIYIHDGKNPVPQDDIFYIVAGNGLFLRKKVGRTDSITPVDKISTLGIVETSARFDMPKIDPYTFSKIINFFKEVYNTYKSEAIVLLYYNDKTNHLKTIVPNQVVSPASAKYIRETSKKDYINLGTIHSHAGMSAFHSGIDDKDEEDVDGIHITIGHMDYDETLCDLSVSIVINGHRFRLNPMDYIDGLEMIEYEKPIEIPNWVSMYNPDYTPTPTKIQAFRIKKEFNKEFSKVWMKYVSMKEGVQPYISSNINVYKRNQLMIDYMSRKGDFDWQSTGYNIDSLNTKEFCPCETCPYGEYKFLKEVEDAEHGIEEDDDDDNDLFNIDKWLI